MLRVFKFAVLSLTAITVCHAQLAPVTYKLQNEVKSLAKVSASGPVSNSITDIIVSGDTIWLGTGSGPSLSTDNGETWTNFYGSSTFGTESIAAIAGNNGIVWASTAHSIDKDGSSVSEGSGLHYTLDYGKTWKSVSQPVDGSGDSALVYGINDGVHLPKVRALPVTVTPQNLTYDIAFTKNTVWIASFAGGLRKSTDMGATWQRVLLPSDNIDSLKPTDTVNFSLQPSSGKFGKENYLNHRVFSVVAANDSTLFVGTAGGINKSTDNGISWVKYTHTNQTQPISGNFVVALAFNKVDKTIWAATWKAEGETESYGVSYSSDMGATWNVSLEGEQAHNFGFKNYEAIAVTDNSAFRTQTYGANWVGINSIVDSKTKISITSKTFYSAGSYGNYVWLGNSDGLARINEYSMWTGEYKVYFASQKLSSKNSTYAYPNPFSPRLDILKISYSTGGSSQNVTIRILDFGMNLVKTVIQSAQRGNPTHVNDAENNNVLDFWNGRDEKGNIVPNGVYFYRIDVGSNDPIYGKVIVIQ